ncbi:MAG: alanine--glyoxylate aminotransferase family protein [Chloroflexi bacterium]|nr:alanine--glyoxylate aminotransferase family protein [Chloroflexota bacterium]MDA1270759.1 alanine--glyoxylate aminotransferase family protein [Chloroflexota bacterium]
MQRKTPQNLRTPGPTPIPSDIVEAMTDPMINHRGPEFAALIKKATEQLKQVFMTKNDLFILTASGTGALEASIVNTLSPGDRVIAATAGAFGDRFVDMVEAYGADVKRMDFEWGGPIDPDAIRKALQAEPNVKAVLVTHNETSTGLTHPVEEIAKVVKGEFDKLLLVDAVSSLGCIPLPVDAWDCDLVGTASQKGFMIPPGLSFVSVSERAWEAQQTAKMPRFYFDLAMAKQYLEQGQSPFTPNLSAMFGLSKALDNLLEEGMENVFGRHAAIAQFTRDGARALGLELLVADEIYASDTVTAIKVPKGVDNKALMGKLRTEYNVVLAGGQGRMTNDIFRIGHLGAVEKSDITEVMDALAKVLPEVGFNP